MYKYVCCYKEWILIPHYLSWINSHILCFALAINLLGVCLVSQVGGTESFLRHVSELLENSKEDSGREKLCLWDPYIFAIAIFPVNQIFCHCSAPWSCNSSNHQLWLSHYREGPITAWDRWNSLQKLSRCQVVISECALPFLRMHNNFCCLYMTKYHSCSILLWICLFFYFLRYY